MELPKPSLSVLSLVGANLVPLLGVLLLDWDAAVIVLLYWTENVVIGFYNILRTTLVKVDSPVFHLRKQKSSSAHRGPKNYSFVSGFP